MIVSDYQRRFEQALASEKPFVSLCQLATTLRDEGVPQIEVYMLFAHYQERTSADDLLYDAIVDTMDEIHGGPCAKGGGFFATTLTDEIIHAARKNA